jgi:nicotinamide mononucleotide transporter
MQTILQQLQNTTALEWIAVVFALAQVIFAVYNYVSNFIFGLISVIIYIYLFYTGGLFAEASLNIYYAIISIVGIYFWLI